MTAEEVKEIIAAHPDAKLYSMIYHCGSTQPYHYMGLSLMSENEAIQKCERFKRFKCGLISEFALGVHYWEERCKRMVIPQDQKALIFTSKWIKEDQL